jgi:hypothetical protein
MNAVLRLPDPAESEAHRRQLLRESDDLLNEVEEMRLACTRSLPFEVQRRVRILQATAGRLPKSPGRLTLRSASEAIFAIQQRLMAANPRRPTIRPHLGRALGSPVVEPIRPGVEWKLLVLPPQPTAPEHEQRWRDLVAATVERALERWFYAQHHAVHAARKRKSPEAALMVARVAWNNYWELAEEASRLVDRAPAVDSLVLMTDGEAA